MKKNSGICTVMTLWVVATSSALAQEQLLLRSASAQALSSLAEVNAAYGVKQLKGLPSLPGTSVMSVPEDRKSAWIAELQKLPNAVTQPLGVTALNGDYRSLFHRPPSIDALTSSQANTVQLLRAQYGAEKVNLLTLAPKALAQEALSTGFDTRDGFNQAGSVSLPLELGRTVSFTQRSLTATQSGTLWRGRPSDATDASLDEASLVSNGENVTGTVRIGRDIYTLKPLGDGVHTITKQSVSDGPPEHPPRLTQKMKDASKRDALPSEPMTVTDSAQIDIMIVFSANVAESEEDIGALATLAIEDANVSLRESGIPGISLRLAHVAATTYKESGVWNDYLDKLPSSNTQAFKQIRKLRDQHKADIVVLVVKDQKYCGEAKDIGVQAAEAYAVVSRVCLLAPRYSLTHELGHLLGARHDLKSDPEVTPHSWVHGFVNGDKWRTVMSYDVCGGCPRILRWSSPHMKHESDPMGSVEFEHDARVWLEFAKRAAAFR